MAAPPHRTARQLGCGELDEMVAAYEAGSTVYQLADQFRQHRTTIGQHLREAGVDTRPPAVADKDVARLAQLYEAGSSLAEIAKRYGVSAHAVRDRLVAAGVKLRARGGSRPSGVAPARH